MPGYRPPALARPEGGAAAKKVTDFAKEVQNKPGDVNARRGDYEEKRLKSATDELAKDAPKGSDGKPDPARQQLADNLRRAMDQKGAYDKARDAFAQGRYRESQGGKLGVDLSTANNGLRNQEKLSQTACRNCNNRNKQSNVFGKEPTADFSVGRPRLRRRSSVRRWRSRQTPTLGGSRME